MYGYIYVYMDIYIYIPFYSLYRDCPYCQPIMCRTTYLHGCKSFLAWCCRRSIRYNNKT